MSDLEFLVYSTCGSALICLGAIFLLGWLRFPWQRREILFMVLSGICTAFVIPTTTLLYSLPISVMVAMIIMRGSVIVISRLIDSVFVRVGLSNKKVGREENIAVVLALAAVGLNLVFATEGDFAFVHSASALSILILYIVSYAIRIFFMNYFKFTHLSGSLANSRNYFAVEQITASILLFGFALLVRFFPLLFVGANPKLDVGLEYFYGVMMDPHPQWLGAAVFGIPFGFSAFFSIFLFMFEGRTATLAGLVNRVSSLLAGTAATLIFAYFFGGKWPRPIDWAAYGLILGAVYFLALAEKRHIREKQ